MNRFFIGDLTAYLNRIGGDRHSQITVQIGLCITEQLVDREFAEVSLIVANGNQVCFNEFLKLEIIPLQVGELAVSKSEVLSQELGITITVAGNRYVVGILSYGVLTGQGIIDIFINRLVKQYNKLVELNLSNLAQLHHYRSHSILECFGSMVKSRIADSLEILNACIYAVLDQSHNSIFKGIQEYCSINCISQCGGQSRESILQEAPNYLCIGIACNCIDNGIDCGLDSCHIGTELNQKCLQLINGGLNLSQFSLNSSDSSLDLSDESLKLGSKGCISCGNRCIKLSLELIKFSLQRVQICLDFGLNGVFEVLNLVINLLFKIIDRVHNLLENTGGLDMIPCHVCDVSTKLFNQIVQSIQNGNHILGIQDITVDNDSELCDNIIAKHFYEILAVFHKSAVRYRSKLLRGMFSCNTCIHLICDILVTLHACVNSLTVRLEAGVKVVAKFELFAGLLGFQNSFCIADVDVNSILVLYSKYKRLNICHLKKSTDSSAKANRNVLTVDISSQRPIIDGIEHTKDHNVCIGIDLMNSFKYLIVIATVACVAVNKAFQQRVNVITGVLNFYTLGKIRR